LPRQVLLPQILNFLYINIPLLGDLVLGSLQFLQEVDHTYLSHFPLCNLMFAVLQVDLKFFDLVVVAYLGGLLATLEGVDVCAEGFVFCLQFHDVLLQTQQQLWTVFHHQIYILYSIIHL
jgi:hypothetical protein